jgi:hypothetical protein
MTLPAEARSHHTVWIDLPGGRTIPVRYVFDGERMVCLGDEGLAAIPTDSQLFVALRELACGPKVSGFRVHLDDVASDAVSLGLLADLLGDRTLGHSTDEVMRNLEHLRATRRLVALTG